LLALVLLAGCSERPQPVLVVPVAKPGAGAAVVHDPAAPRPVPRSYAQELGKADEAISAALRQIDQQPDNLVLVKETVLMLVERARLTGLTDDYRLASEMLARAPASSANTAKLCQGQARLDFALHRLPAASTALAACGGFMDTAQAAALAADIAFYSGQYPQAQRIYQGLLNQGASSSQFIRMAIYRWKTGSLVEAGALLEAAERRYHGGEASTRAWLKLQRGLIAWDRGQLEEALALYRLADDAMPGWWQVDAQIAEVLRLQGDVAGARTLMERLAASGERPELMDELARLLREGQTPDAAQPWIKRAQAIHNTRLADFPEASAGHATEHYLQFGTPAQALALARRDVALRNFGDTQITMAAALFRAGQAGEAARWIQRVSDSGWNTARLHAVAAQVYAALGQNTQADAERAQALAMNPHAMRLYLVAQPVQPELVSMQ